MKKSGNKNNPLLNLHYKQKFIIIAIVSIC